MSIMQQSSKAQDRTLGVWFQNIQQGMVKLPRFQRFEAWDRNRIASYLNTIINNLPVGVTLVLEVAGQEKFESRYLATSNPAASSTVTQHLLDGQQRLTAFWRSLHNNYENETYYVYLPEFETRALQNSEDIEVHCEGRWINKKTNSFMPLWADDPIKCLDRGLFPIDLLCPGDKMSAVDSWIVKATKPYEPSESEPDAFTKYKKYTELKDRLKSVIMLLRERVTHFNLPYLSLPADTDKDVALQVFINMNTNSKPLSLYDIIVAEVESVADQSLHDMQAALSDKQPEISRYGSVSELILSTSALLQDKLPNNRGMIEMDKRLLLQKWPDLEKGLRRMASFLESQRVFDHARLPTNAVLAVIAAAYELIPDNGDFLAKAERLLRRYLWSAFFSDRYENSAASRAFADFKAIKELLKNPGFSDTDLSKVPVLNRSEFPLADVDSLVIARWPKGVGINARAILAVTTYLGAIDFADHRPATFESIQNREYHHVFPDSLLSEAGIHSSLALNCALITWKTNRTIGRKDPLEYLQDRVQWAGEDVVRERLKSHLISFDLLSKAKYGGLKDEEFKRMLSDDFNLFLRDRASLVFSAMSSLTEGDSPTLESLWTAHLADSTINAETTA